MAGVVMNPVQAAGPDVRTEAPSHVNTFRISGVVDRVLAHVRGGPRNDNKEICLLCIHLSRAIDYAVGNNVIPDRVSELPYLLKQVRQWTNDENLQTAIMVLMISIKGACRNRWFSEKDNEELNTLWTEIATGFCSVRDMDSGESIVNHKISTVLSRFYPRMKMGEIFAFIEAMPGYGAFVKDFHITKNAKSPHEEVYLFVAQTDNTETASCITSPQLVNFLMNGKAVDRRTCINKDPGPQIPTPVTNLVKHGTNLLQAVGQFNGKYIIVVALMSTITNPSCPALPDYVPPVAAASDLDNDIVEGPSRISLNCPISFTRIMTPVKGHLCKHLQCFDFENYVNINSRRPSWRCPHCSQSVCFTDIRIDQGMAKVLKEVDATISHVKFSANGSWKAVNEGDDHADTQEDKSLLHQESNPSKDTGADIMDLTEGDNDIDNDASNSHQENERKPTLAQLQDLPNPSDQIPSHLNMNPVHTNISPHMENTFLRPTHENVAISQGQTNNMPLPAHAIGTSSTVTNPNFPGQTQTSASSMQFQQHGMNSMSNDYGQRYMARSRHITRIPIAVQALPVQNLAGTVNGDRPQQYSASYTDQYQIMRMIRASNPSMFENMGAQDWVHHGLSNVSSQPAQQFGAHSSPSHQPSGHHFNSYQHQSVNHMIPNSMQSPFVGPTTGSINHQLAHHYAGSMTDSISNQQAHHYAGSMSGSISNQQAHHYAGSMAGSIRNQQAHHYAGSMAGSVSNQQAHHYAGSMSGSISNQQAHHYVGPTNSSISNQQTHSYANATATQAFHHSWTPPTPAPLPTSLSSMPVISPEGQRGLGQAFSTQEGSANAPAADQNWRPTGRMRGSLGDRAYSDAYSQSIIYPTQPLQAASPPVLNTPRPFIPPHLRVLVANNINANSLQEDAGGLVLE